MGNNPMQRRRGNPDVGMRCDDVRAHSDARTTKILYDVIDNVRNIDNGRFFGRWRIRAHARNEIVKLLHRIFQTPDQISAEFRAIAEFLNVCDHEPELAGDILYVMYHE